MQRTGERVAALEVLLQRVDDEYEEVVGVVQEE